jgi:Tol biopolymer transport system component
MRFTIIAAAAVVSLGTSSASVQRIVFARPFPNVGQIVLYTSAADGSDERPLLQTRDVDYDGTWSPDGTAIVFTSERDGSADLYRVKPDGTALERLTDDPAYDDQAAFSPDGRQLVFVSTRKGGYAHVWTMDLQSRRAKALTSGTSGDFRPSWSPDGSGSRSPRIAAAISRTDTDAGNIFISWICMSSTPTAAASSA